MKLDDPLLLDSLPESRSEGLWSLIRSGRLGQYIERLLTDQGARSLVAARSYRHVNGFEKIVIFSPTTNAQKIRLHVWPSGMTEMDGDVHAHRWSFSSVVIAGTLFTVNYEIADKGERYLVMVYAPKGKSGEFQLKPQGRAECLAARTSYRLPEGSSYDVDAAALHVAANMDATEAMTVVLQSDVTSRENNVYRRQDGATGDEVSMDHASKTLDEGRVLARLSEARQRLLRHEQTDA